MARDLPDDRLYYQTRIERERALAKAARHPEAARAHANLAQLYRDRLGREAQAGLEPGGR